MRRILLLLILGFVAVGMGASPLFSPLEEVRELIRTYYLWAEEVQDEELLYGAIRGMIDALDDPYSTFFTPEEYARWQESLSGDYSGVGMEITVRDGRVTVVSPLPGTPAEAAGIRSGDWIKAVQGEPTEGRTLEEVSARIRGPEGKAVTLTVQHPDGQEETITLIRARIHLAPVRWEYLEEEQVGYVRVLRFHLDTEASLGQALYSLPLDELQGIVLDLRNNPGGLLSAAVEVASFFVDQGVIVRREGPASGTHVHLSQGNALPNLPLAVLVNEGTASASEIVAGAIQDHGAGVLVGRPTFGKGLIQEVVAQLPDGSAIKLTTGEYRTPSGHQVEGVGLTPDIPVEIEGVPEGEDPDLAAALAWIQSHAPVAAIP